MILDLKDSCTHG